MGPFGPWTHRGGSKIFKMAANLLKFKFLAGNRVGWRVPNPNKIKMADKIKMAADLAAFLR